MYLAQITTLNGFVSSKIYDKRDDFYFDIINFLVFPAPLIMVFTSFFALMSSHLTDFHVRNKSLTAKLLQQEYRHHKLLIFFSKFYCRHFQLFLI